MNIVAWDTVTTTNRCHVATSSKLPAKVMKKLKPRLTQKVGQLTAAGPQMRCQTSRASAPVWPEGSGTFTIWPCAPRSDAAPVPG